MLLLADASPSDGQFLQAERDGRVGQVSNRGPALGQVELVHHDDVVAASAPVFGHAPVGQVGHIHPGDHRACGLQHLLQLQQALLGAGCLLGLGHYAEPARTAQQVAQIVFPQVAPGHEEAREVFLLIAEGENTGADAARNAEHHGFAEGLASVGVAHPAVGQQGPQSRRGGDVAGEVGALGGAGAGRGALPKDSAPGAHVALCGLEHTFAHPALEVLLLGHFQSPLLSRAAGTPCIPALGSEKLVLKLAAPSRTTIPFTPASPRSTGPR